MEKIFFITALNVSVFERYFEKTNLRHLNFFIQLSIVEAAYEELSAKGSYLIGKN